MATIRQKVLASLCMVGGEKGRSLFAFTASADKEVLEQLIHQWGEKDPSDGAVRLRKLIRLNRLSLLGEIHPGWFLEKLGDESPRLLSALRYFLGAEQLQYLRSHLSPEVCKAFGGTEPPSADLLPVLANLVEKKLGIVMPSRMGGAFTLDHMGWIKASDQRILFRQLGLGEISKAFSGVDAKVLRIFLSRFPLPMVQEIHAQFHKSGVVPVLERQQAQTRLLDLSFDQIPVERLFEEVGYAVFARTLTPQERGRFEILALRMRPADGYRLKKRIAEIHVTEDEATQNKEHVLGMIYRLAEQGLIHKFWRQEIESTITERQVA